MITEHIPYAYLCSTTFLNLNDTKMKLSKNKTINQMIIILLLHRLQNMLSGKVKSIVLLQPRFDCPNHPVPYRMNCHLMFHRYFYLSFEKILVHFCRNIGTDSMYLKSMFWV